MSLPLCLRLLRAPCIQHLALALVFEDPEHSPATAGLLRLSRSGMTDRHDLDHQKDALGIERRVEIDVLKKWEKVYIVI